MVRNLVFKPLYLGSSVSRTRRKSAFSVSFALFSSILGFQKSTSPFLQQDAEDDDAVEAVFRIITTSKDVKTSLKSAAASISFSNYLIDKVLKRVRFSHSNPFQALEFFNFTAERKGFIHSAFSLDTMLYVLGRSRKFDLIWDILYEIKKKDQSLITPRTVQVVLGRIAKVCSVRQTVDSLRKFRKLVLDLDTTYYNALLRALCQEKSMTDARNVYHSLKHEFQPNLQTFNILLSGWKSSDEAEMFFKEMKDLGVKPDIVSYNCLVDVYCKGREMEKADRVVKEMKERDIDPDVITYTILIGGLGLVGQPDKAKEILKEMVEYGCYPDVAAYNAAIKNFCIARRIKDAYNLMEEMIYKGLSPNPTTYNVFLRAFSWCNDLRGSWDLYLRMKRTGCLPNSQSCMFLIKLIKRHEEVEMGLELWNDMVEKGFGSYTLVSVVLFDLLCDLGRLEEAERCFLQMVEKGQKPSHASFKRIKILMELTKKHDDLLILTEKMNSFGPSIRKITFDYTVKHNLLQLNSNGCTSDV